jgi:hypothetical protein
MAIKEGAMYGDRRRGLIDLSHFSDGQIVRMSLSPRARFGSSSDSGSENFFK